MTRQFTHSPAKRERVPLLIGIIGASGSGKTYSALRLATGIVRVTGGTVFGIDTEARRMAHYADTFKFQHVEFGAPFNPLSYLEAIRYCSSNGAGCIVVDSMSHEHESEGGVLDMHEKELDEIAGNDWKKRERSTGRAWIKPKAERRALVNGILQLRTNMIFCFRAQEKIDWKHKTPDGKLVELGWQPIAGQALVYEMTARCLLQPGADGVPDWNPKIAAEHQLVKRPQQFRALFYRLKGRPLSEEMGEAMARWASGETDASPAGPSASTAIAEATTLEQLRAIWGKLSREQKAQHKAALDARKAELSAGETSERQPGEEG